MVNKLNLYIKLLHTTATFTQTLHTDMKLKLIYNCKIILKKLCKTFLEIILFFRHNFPEAPGHLNM